MDDFFKPKLFYADITQKLNFCRCDEVMFCNNTTWYYRTLSVQLGENAVRMFSIYVLNIPIPNISDMPLATLYGLSESESRYIDNLP